MENDFGLFAAVMVAFHRFSDEQWGRLGMVKHESTEEKSYTFPFSTLKGGTVDFYGGQIVLGQKISGQRVLVGRRTHVYEATVRQAGKLDRPGVVKMCYQVTGRTREWKFIEDAQAQGVDHLPEVIFYRDFSKSSEGVWGDLCRDSSYEYKDRVLRLIVFPRYTPIFKVLSPGNFIQVLHQLVDCE